MMTEFTAQGSRIKEKDPKTYEASMRNCFSFAMILISLNGWAGNALENILIEVENPKSSLTSIDQVIALHPNPRGDFTMRMKASDSNEDASSLYPRYLNSDPQSGLLFGFNGHKSQAGYETLQLAFPSGSAWEWAEVREVNGKLKVIRRPTNCLKCHGDNGKDSTKFVPIVQAYPEWDGAYGADSDFLDDKEVEEYAAHGKIAKNHLRYKLFSKDPTGDGPFLEILKKESLSDYKLYHSSFTNKAGNEQLYSDRKNEETGRLFRNRRPNLNFGKSVGLSHARVIAQRSLDRNLDDYLTILLLRKCRSWVGRSLKKKIDALHGDLGRIARLNNKPPVPDNFDFFYGDFWKHWQFVQGYFLKISPTELNLRGPKINEDKSSPYFSRYWDGAYELSDLIDAAIIGALPASSNPRIPSKLKTGPDFNKYGMSSPDLKDWDLKADSKATEKCTAAVESGKEILQRHLKILSAVAMEKPTEKTHN